MDDDDAADDAVLIDRSNHIQPTIPWRTPSMLPDMPDVAKAELISNEKALQESRMRSVPAVRYTSESDVASSPNPLTDVEQALDMTSQASAVMASIPFFVPQETIPLAATNVVPMSLFSDVTSALQSISQQPEPQQPAYPGATFIGASPEFLQSLGLPMFLIGQDTQALQTIANSPGLLGTLVDATGQYDQQRLLSLVHTLSSGTPSHGQHAAPSAYGQPAPAANIYGQPAPAPQAAYGTASTLAPPRVKSDAGNLHVSGFGPSTTQNDIVQLFSPYVRVDEVFMKGSFCFVNTSDPVNAQIAKEALTGTLLGGMPIRINPAQRKTPREASAYGPSSGVAVGSAMSQPPMSGMPPSIPRMPPPPPPHAFSAAPVAPPMLVQNVDDVRDDRGNPATKNLFVAGYGPSTTEQQLRDLFSQFAEVIGVVTKGAFSFVNTQQREQAVACRQAFMGTMLNGGALRINFAKESGRLGTSFDLTYGKDTGPNARAPGMGQSGPGGPGMGMGRGVPPMSYNAPPPFGAQPAYGTGGAQPGYGGGGAQPGYGAGAPSYYGR